MKKIKYILFFLIYSSLSSLAQSFELDKNFGKNGRVKINNGWSHNIFYDQDTQYIYLTYTKIVNNNFSGGFRYYKDGVCKIDIITGDYDKQFGHKGNSIHSLNSSKRTCWAGETWQSSGNEIFNLNYRTEDKDILIFDMLDGSIRTFPSVMKMHSDSLEFPLPLPIYYDHQNDRFLTIYDNKIFWFYRDHYDVVDSFTSLVDKTCEVYGIKFITEKNDSVIVLLREYFFDEETSLNHKIISINHKIIAINNENSTLLDSFKTGPNTGSDLWGNKRPGICLYDPDSIYIKTDVTVKNDYWTGLDREGSKFHEYKFINYTNNKIIALSKMSVPDDYNHDGFYAVIDEYYSITKINIGTGKLDTYSLDSVIPEDMFITKIESIGENTYFILVRKAKKKKSQYYLYKVILN